ncbi:hypothetical protein C8Q77DRAFT_1073574 [Trametes polyzona]|nr:hypothetical protein C8Q77DRAFT_1073574 [Trametes polyzona]
MPYPMLSRLNIIQFVPPQPNPEEDTSPRLHAARDRLRAELRSEFTGKVRTKSGRPKATMSYTMNHYARRLVINSKLKLVGWPSHIPFRNLSKIGGGIRPLQELHRLWNLTDPVDRSERLQFVPSTAEDRRNAARDPLSVHPNRPMYEMELAAAAAAEAARARAQARDGSGTQTGAESSAAQPTDTTVVACMAVEVGVLHPTDLGLLGTQLTSTQAQRGVVFDGDELARDQRRDMGGRRPRATDKDPRFKKRPKRGITSFRFIIPGNAPAGAHASGQRLRTARADHAVQDPLNGITWVPGVDGTDGGDSDVEEIESLGDWSELEA